MSFNKLLNHTCDIYHLQKTSASPGFGLKESPSFSYPDEPDINASRCHFNSGGTVGSTNINQKEPQNIFSSRVKVNFPKGTDIRVNDKIIHLETGYEYTAEAPTQIRNHHITAILKRTNEQEPL